MLQIRQIPFFPNSDLTLHAIVPTEDENLRAIFYLFIFFFTLKAGCSPQLVGRGPKLLGSL